MKAKLSLYRKQGQCLTSSYVQLEQNPGALPPSNTRPPCCNPPGPRTPARFQTELRCPGPDPCMVPPAIPNVCLFWESPVLEYQIATRGCMELCCNWQPMWGRRGLSCSSLGLWTSCSPPPPPNHSLWVPLLFSGLLVPHQCGWGHVVCGGQWEMSTWAHCSSKWALKQVLVAAGGHPCDVQLGGG